MGKEGKRGVTWPAASFPLPARALRRLQATGTPLQEVRNTSPKAPLPRGASGASKSFASISHSCGGSVTGTGERRSRQACLQPTPSERAPICAGLARGGGQGARFRGVEGEGVLAEAGVRLAHPGQRGCRRACGGWAARRKGGWFAQRRVQVPLTRREKGRTGRKGRKGRRGQRVDGGLVCGAHLGRRPSPRPPAPAWRATPGAAAQSPRGTPAACSSSARWSRLSRRRLRPPPCGPPRS